MAAISGQSSNSEQAPRVSVVIAVFNGGDELEQCLAAVAASSLREFECIVVDDGSTDGRAEPAAARHGARLIRLERQQGPAHARNVGAHAARSDLLFFTDADVLLHADTLAVAMAALDSSPGLSAVFGSYDDRPGHGSFLSQYRNLYHHWVHQTGSTKASTFWSGCGAIRRHIFLDMGGFSVNYRHPSIEDIELGTRLRQAGHGIRLEKTMLATHLKRWSFWNMLRTDIFRRGVPWMELLLREGHLHNELNLSLTSRIATALAGLFMLSLLVLPLSGHAAAVGPALAVLLGGAFSAWLWHPEQRRGWDVAITAALLLAAPLATFALAPDPWAAVPLLLLLGLTGTQSAFYRYLARKRSASFALGVVPMQLLFFLGCGLAVPLGLMRHHFLNRRLPAGTT